MKALFLVLTLALLSGCVTFESTRPAVSGQVVKAANHAPIAEACVTFTSGPDLYFTDPQGRFAIPAHYGLRFYPIIFPVDHFPRHTLSVQKKGYLTREIPVLGGARQPGLLIEMRSVPPGL
jgi:hypothetical protein